MNEQPEPLPPTVTLVETPPTVLLVPHKGWTKLSWLVILSAVGVILGFRMLPTEAAEKKADLAARIDLKVMRLQLQLFVALRSLAPGMDPADLYSAAEQLGEGDPSKVLRISAFAADMIGPKEALKLLDALQHDADAKLTAEDRGVADVLRRLYGDQLRGAFDHPSVSDEQADELQAQLGWFGALALFPAVDEDTLQARAAVAGAGGPAMLERYREGRRRVIDQATETLTVLVVCAGVGLLVLVLGFAGLPIFVLLWVAGGIRVGLRPGIAHGGVYAETFAIWFVLYIGLLLGGELLLHDWGSAVARGSIAMPLSLVVVAWPVLRGVPWRQVRQDIGWTAGRHPLLEPGCGFVCYVVNVPIVLAGFLVTVTLAAGYAALRSQTGGGESPGPTHPVLEQLSHPDWPSLVLFFFLLSVVAPVVEETMFRGFLHRHLREVFFRRHPLLGGLCTAFVVNLIFAAIHPQGLMFIPVLMALACGFSLAREWRGTLIPAMVAHGTNNFLVGLMAALLLSR